MSPHRVAVVTGSSSGIGLLTSIALARDGYFVVATMRDLSRRERLDEAARKAPVNQRLDVRRLDVTEFSEAALIVDNIARDYGRIDLLVNNAGFSLAGFAEDTTLAELRRQFETNFFGAVAMSKAVLPIMRRQRSGHIIQVTSVGGRVGNPMLSAYCSSKFALEGWSESLRIETHSLGIRVAIVEPGSFDTDIWTRNVTIAQGGLDSSSPNKERSQRFAEFVKSRAKHRSDPLQVAQLIVRLANNPNPALRYMIGRDAIIQAWMQRLMPWNRYERVVAKAVKID